MAQTTSNTFKPLPGGDASWPYGPLPQRLANKGTPRWECLGGECVCHPTQGERKLEQHTIFFHDENGKRMANARCRVFLESGPLPTTQNAGGDGSLAVEVPEAATVLALEWAPSDVPLVAPYPFRRTYHLKLGDETEEGVRRRLHNLGFARPPSLREKIEAFQQTYELPVDGKAESAFPTLAGYHDSASLPPIVERPAGDGSSRKERHPDPPLAPDLRPPSQGCVAALELGGPKDCHFSFVLLDRQSEEPVPNAPFILEIGDATLLYGQTDGSGGLQYGDVEAGHYLLRIGDIEMTVPSIPKDKSRRPLIVERDR
jgi:hypothetical protein